MTKILITTEGNVQRLYINDMEVTGLVSYALSVGNDRATLFTFTVMAEEVKIL